MENLKQILKSKLLVASLLSAMSLITGCGDDNNNQPGTVNPGVVGTQPNCNYNGQPGMLINGTCQPVTSAGVLPGFNNGACASGMTYIQGAAACPCTSNMYQNGSYGTQNGYNMITNNGSCYYYITPTQFNSGLTGIYSQYGYNGNSWFMLPSSNYGWNGSGWVYGSGSYRYSGSGSYGYYGY